MRTLRIAFLKMQLNKIIYDGLNFLSILNRLSENRCFGKFSSHKPFSINTKFFGFCILGQPVESRIGDHVLNSGPGLNLKNHRLFTNNTIPDNYPSLGDQSKQPPLIDIFATLMSPTLFRFPYPFFIINQRDSLMVYNKITVHLDRL